jgi:hypothetical protein
MKLTPITDPAEIARIIAQGKYREHLPFWTRSGDTLWVEKVTVGNRL